MSIFFRRLFALGRFRDPSRTDMFAQLGKLSRNILGKRRYADYGLKRIPVAVIDHHLSHGAETCKRHAIANILPFRGCVHESSLSVSKPFLQTAAMMNLHKFGSALDFERAVSRASHGNDNRLVKKARRLGLRAEMIDIRGHDKDYWDIRNSKHMRSGGKIVSGEWGGQLRPPHPVKPRFSECQQHWRFEWGIFDRDNRMVAFAMLNRSGNLVNMMQIMGHGDALKDGAVKLLLFDIVRWLKDDGSPVTQGVDFLVNGTVEYGGAGGANWKRYGQFEPHVIDGQRWTRKLMPKGFSSRRYMASNPHLRAGESIRLSTISFTALTSHA